MRKQQIKVKAALAALMTVGFGSMCMAEEVDRGPTQRPVMTVSAGQAGYIRLPDLGAPQQAYSLTGRRESSEAWQHAAGPMLRVGNASIVLSQAR